MDDHHSTFDAIRVGDLGTGTLTISNGGSVRMPNGDTVIARAGGSSGTLRVESGPEGGGTLTTGTDGYIGGGIGGQDGSPGPGTGTATVTGDGSQWSIAQNLIVGTGGPGTLFIQENGTVSVGGDTTVAGGSQGTLNITLGGALETPSLVRGSGAAQVNFDRGILRATADTRTSSAASPAPSSMFSRAERPSTMAASTLPPTRPSAAPAD